MAGSFSDYMEQETLEWITGQTSDLGTPPSTIYVALYTTAPTDAGGGVEVSGGGYARQDSAGKWGAPSSGSVSNDTEIPWPTATGDWGTVVAAAIFDALAGNMLAWADLTASKVVNTDDTFKFPIGNLTVTLD